ncbi:MAG: GNAT family N-acetyltransferase [Hyphomicrobiales bacterium]|nr:MAG: GNAT family N-acetyltransferase [Hyphomicrobiales bacterium]
MACDADLDVGEVAISVSADHKQRGIGWELLRHITRFAETKGVKRLQSLENRSNNSAIEVEVESGFKAAPYGGDAGLVLLEKVLAR